MIRSLDIPKLAAIPTVSVGRPVDTPHVTTTLHSFSTDVTCDQEPIGALHIIVDLF